MAVYISQVAMSLDTAKTADDLSLAILISGGALPSGQVSVAVCKSFAAVYANLGIIAEKKVTFFSTAVTVSFTLSELKSKAPGGFYVTVVSGANVIGNVVRLFADAPVLARYMLEPGGILRLFQKRDTTESRIAAGIDAEIPLDAALNVALENEVVKCELPEGTIRLASYGLADRVECGAKLRYTMRNQDANVFGYYTPRSFLVAAPPVEAVTVRGGNLLIKTSAAWKGALRARLYGGEACLFTADLTKSGGQYSWELATLELDRSLSYEVAFSARDDAGESYPTRRFRVMPEPPRIKGCRFVGTGSELLMGRGATYLVSYGETSKVLCGDRLPLDAAPDSVTVSYASNGAFSEPVSYPLANPAYYSFQNPSGETFYRYGTRPLSCPASESVIPLSGEAAEFLDGVYFQIRSASPKELVVMPAYFTAPSGGVLAEYAKLKEACGQSSSGDAPYNAAAVKALETAVRRDLPMRAGDMLAFYYGFCPEGGYVDLHPGMILSVEHAVFQNVPKEFFRAEMEEKRLGASVFGDLSGFVGSAASEYAVIARDGKISFEPFVKALTAHSGFTVPPPPEIFSDNHLSGGAGVSDLLFPQLSAPFVRLVYPAAHTPRNTGGAMDMSGNITVLAADSYASLGDATSKLRAGNQPVSGVAYAGFRGRVSAVPKVEISVDGHRTPVSLGTAVGDLLDRQGYDRAENLLLERTARSGAREVCDAGAEMPFLMGDRLTFLGR